MTKKEREVIEEIANYIIAYYPIRDGKYVRLETVLYLQNLAKELLKNGKRRS